MLKLGKYLRNSASIMRGETDMAVTLYTREDQFGLSSIDKKSIVAFKQSGMYIMGNAESGDKKQSW